ncbi:hypothetical protein RvY_11947 [Ramazzottius varieornatus]|uniref:Uncharacterized protein n=1 Tax=Ramazzottius varieornatus TaxID=947166 RepID=A0A1D1VHW3_RAMVA|nr:hypothetical protein RvY_11947 [Ramazzottius varieornatus]
MDFGDNLNVGCYLDAHSSSTTSLDENAVGKIHENLLYKKNWRPNDAWSTDRRIQKGTA